MNANDLLTGKTQMNQYIAQGVRLRGQATIDFIHRVYQLPVKLLGLRAFKHQ